MPGSSAQHCSFALRSTSSLARASMPVLYFDDRNFRRATTRAIRPTHSPQRVSLVIFQRASRPTQSPQRVRFPCSTFAPRHSKGGSTRPNSAEGALWMLKNSHISTARTISPTQSRQRVRFPCSKLAPHGSDPNLRSGFTFLKICIVL